MNLPVTTPIGAQLYIFGDKFDLSRDLDLLLDSLRGDGYGAVEGHPAHQTDYRAALAARNLAYCGPHMVLKDTRSVEPTAAYVRQMGGADICSSGLIAWHERTPDDYRRAALLLNDVGRQYRERGIHLHYHNHEFEFGAVDGGTTGMEILLAERDPDGWDLCLDLGWVWRGGLDPALYLRRVQNAVGYVHLRDFKGAQSVPLGQGDVNLDAVMDAVSELPFARWIVVEQDPTAPDPVDAMRISRRFLQDRYGV